jgi:hypothetical protein
LHAGSCLYMGITVTSVSIYRWNKNCRSRFLLDIFWVLKKVFFRISCFNLRAIRLIVLTKQFLSNFLMVNYNKNCQVYFKKRFCSLLWAKRHFQSSIFLHSEKHGTFYPSALVVQCHWESFCFNGIFKKVTVLNNKMSM